METHLNRLRMLYKKRSVGGLALWVFAIFWKRLSDWQNVEWLGRHAVPNGLAKIMVYPNLITVGFVVAGIVWFSVILLWPEKKERDSTEETGPEVVLEYEPKYGTQDGRLVVRNLGEGSARNVQLEKITAAHWAAESEPIAYLAVGTSEKLQTRLYPTTPQAKGETLAGGKMTLDVLLMGASEMEQGCLSARVTHEDSAQQRKYETDFAITYPVNSKSPYFAQKGRRARKRHTTWQRK